MHGDDTLETSLRRAAEMQVQEMDDLPDDADPDEMFARKVWQQELLGTKRPNSFSNPKPPKRRQSIVHGKECSTCLETKRDRDMTELNCCKTLFCRTCFQTWFETSLADKMVPKCCGQEIMVEDHLRLLKSVIRRRYSEVKDEVDADRKIYCSNSACGRFIKIDGVNLAFAQCKKCRRKTCVACGDALTAHGKKRKTCPNYLNDETLREILSSHEWNRCPACFAPVEKTEGCNNIRCTCGTMFCFRCGDRKKGERDGCTCTRLPPRQMDPPRSASNPAYDLFARTDTSLAVGTPGPAIPLPDQSTMTLNPQIDLTNMTEMLPPQSLQQSITTEFHNMYNVPLNSSAYLFRADNQVDFSLTTTELPSITDDPFGEDLETFMTWLETLQTSNRTDPVGSVWL